MSKKAAHTVKTEGRNYIDVLKVSVVDVQSAIVKHDTLRAARAIDNLSRQLTSLERFLERTTGLNVVL